MIFPRHREDRRKIREAHRKAEAQLQRAKELAAETNRIADSLDDTRSRNHLVEGLQQTLTGDGLIDIIRKRVSSWVHP